MLKASSLLVLLACVVISSVPAAQYVTLSVSPPSVSAGFASTVNAIPAGFSSGSTYSYAWDIYSFSRLSGCGPSDSLCTVYGTMSNTVNVVVTVPGTPTVANSITVTVVPYQCILGTTGDLGSCIIDSIPIAVAGIALSLCFVAIAFMLGEVFLLEGLSNWYKTELWECTKSGLVLCCVYGGLVMASNISVAIASSALPSSSAQPCIAGSILDQNLCMLYQDVYNGYITPQLQVSYSAFSGIFGLDTGVEMLKSILLSTWCPLSFPIPDTDLEVTTQWGSTIGLMKGNYLAPSSPSGLSFLKDVTSMVVTPVLLIFQSLYVLLPTIAILGLAVFLPIGMILRAIPFLRGIGGTMIAVGITISLIFPTTLLALNVPVTSYLTPLYSSVSAGTSDIFTCSGLDCLATGLLETVTMGLASANSGVLSWLIGPNAVYASFLEGFGTGLYNIDSIYPAMNFVTYETTGLALQVILIVLDLMICLVAANAIARPLGGRVGFGIGKLKLA
jgi:hypothetical protein